MIITPPQGSQGSGTDILVYSDNPESPVVGDIWMLDDTIVFLERFNNSLLNTDRVQDLTSGSGSVIETTLLSVACGATNTDAAAAYLKHQLDKKIRTIKHRFNLSGSAGTFMVCQRSTAPAVVSNTAFSDEYRIFLSIATNGGTSTLYYKKPDDTNSFTQTTSVVSNTDYDFVIETSETQIRAELRQTDGTVILTTNLITFNSSGLTGLKDDTNPYWYYWGEIRNDSSTAQTINTSLLQVA